MAFSERLSQNLARIRWSSKTIVGALLLLMAAYYLGILIVDPQRRVIQAAAALLLFYLASRLSMYQSLAFFLMVFPYPTVTSVGSTNTLILLTIFIIWGTRVAAGELKFEFRSLLSPILPAVALSYLVSTYSIQTHEAFVGSMGVLFDVLAAMILYLLVTNFVRDEKTLMRTLFFLGISSILIHFVAVYEVLFPGHDFLPGWILSDRGQFAHLVRGSRTQGPFQDYELLSEYCAVTTPIVIFMLLRSAPRQRGLWLVVASLTLFSLFATVTRGGLLSLGLGLVYLFWLMRKEMGPVRAAGTLVVVVAGMAAVGLVMPHMFRMASLLDRLSETKFQNGIPDSRIQPWTQSVERIREHVVLGHGPWYDLGSGLKKYTWPHNGYFFLWVTIGLPGLLAYLAMFFTCFFATGKRRGPLLRGPLTPGLLTALHVSWLVFMVDQVKIDFERNRIYFVFSWFLMALTASAYQIARDQQQVAQAESETPPEAARSRELPVLEPVPADYRARKIMDL